MNVFLADEQDEPVSATELRALAESVLVAEGLPDDTEVGLVLVGEDQMAGINGRFLQREGATDVLALPLEDLEPGRPPADVPGGPPVNLGDVYICPAYVKRQAEREGVAYETEMALMVVHGILHLLGYDHELDAEAEAMESRERDLLAGFAARPR